MQIGSLAEWLAGVGTIGSLYLGFTILKGDRRKAEQAEATQVVAWFVNQKDGNTELSVTNGASRPIVHVMFCLASVDQEGKPAALWRMFNIAPVLAPGEGSSLSLPFAEFHANVMYPSYIQFRDANGLSWQRNVRSAKLRKTKVGPSLMRRLKHAKSRRNVILILRYRRW